MLFITSPPMGVCAFKTTAVCGMQVSVKNCHFLKNKAARHIRLNMTDECDNTNTDTTDATETHNDAPKSPRVSIDYCTGCRWLLRSSWMLNELLITFENDIGEAALRPSNVPGTFNVWVDGQLIWSRKQETSKGNKGFPELKELKQRVRDVIQPDMSLGHSDRA